MDAANEVDKVAVGAVADAVNEVEEVMTSGIAEVVANGLIDVEEEEIDLNNIPIYIEVHHTTKFDFMADCYVRSPIAMNADPVVMEEVPEEVPEVAGGDGGRRR